MGYRGPILRMFVMYFLVSYTDILYCQGWDTVRGLQLLVYADTFDEACAKIKKKYKDARDFENLTLV